MAYWVVFDVPNLWCLSVAILQFGLVEKRSCLFLTVRVSYARLEVLGSLSTCTARLPDSFGSQDAVDGSQLSFLFLEGKALSSAAARFTRFLGVWKTAAAAIKESWAAILPPKTP